MPKYKKGQTASPESTTEAQKIAQSVKKPGQSKEQTKLITQGIQKGIEQYKKQQNAKSREIDKKRKHTAKPDLLQTPPDQPNALVQSQQHWHWLSWTLLVLTWLGIGVYFIALRR